MKNLIFIYLFCSLILNYKAQTLNEFQKISPTESHSNQFFGYSTSINGNRIIVGAPQDTINGLHSGSAYIYEFNGTNWQLMSKLIPSDGIEMGVFGQAVAIDGNYAVVGADLSASTQKGAVYVFELINGNWIERYKITGDDSFYGDAFGVSVSLSQNKLIVGAPEGLVLNNSVGKVYLFEIFDTYYLQITKLTASDNQIGDVFGNKVSIDNNTIVVGNANHNNDLGLYTGVIYIYEYDGLIWNETARLFPSDGQNNDLFGATVSVDNNIVVVGSLYNGSLGQYSGAVYVFEKIGSSWIEKVQLSASDGTINQSYGCSVSISNNKIIVGAYGDEVNGINSGAAYIYVYDGLNWNEKAKLYATDEATEHFFAGSVNIFDDLVICGATGHTNTGSNTGSAYIFYLKGITARIYNDLNINCLREISEQGLINFSTIINPGNIIVQTNVSGFWRLDSLPAGNYTITIDTSNTNWTPTCPITQSFTVVHPDSLTIAPSFGMVANNPCPSPSVSVNMPFMRPCFTGQQVHVQACNEYDATGVLPDAYSIVALDPNLIFESASLPYTSLGNNQYRFEHDTLYPGQCVNYTISTQVDCNAPLGLTLCLEANLYPVAACVLDTIPTPSTGEVTPCTLPWDQSSLSVEGWCANDSIYFTITNTGELGGGDMECYSPVRVFVDGVSYLLDSIKLLGGETFTYVFAGNGATWILEADQHPLHPGNSHPNAHVENCNPGNWTPDIVNNFPTDDADPVKDIYCGVVTGSYDPNDKKGTPYGLGAEHEVLPNQDIEYLIRFQNTGTDTAFTVVVRDTLDIDFDIFSVTPGSASHNYSFRMYGPRVLEWTFSNILLPDSTTNEPLSNGFLSYRVKQKPNLADGTLLTNEADIYFDFNAPIITNETSHKVQRRIFEPTNSLESLSQTKTGIKLYPNPTKQETTLSFSTYQKQVSYKLLNLSGQVVLEKSNLYGKELKVNLSEIPNGMYLMEVNTNQGTEIMKVVKD